MASGIEIETEIRTVFNDELKQKRIHRYLLIGVSPDLKKIGIMKKADRDSTWEDLQADLKEAESKMECRFALFDLDFTLANGQPKDKLLFIHWSPDQVSMKQKMVYASSVEALKRDLAEGFKNIQANDYGDLSLPDIIADLRSTARN